MQKRRQYQICKARIDSWKTSISLSTTRSSSGEFSRFDYTHLTLQGELLSALKGQVRFCLRAMSWPPELPARERLQKSRYVANLSVSGKIGVEVATFYSDFEMSMLLTLAASDRLKGVVFSCDEPYRGRADVSSLQVNTKEPEAIE